MCSKIIKNTSFYFFCKYFAAISVVSSVFLVILENDSTLVVSKNKYIYIYIYIYIHTYTQKLCNQTRTSKPGT